MKVLVSWSGERGKHVAYALRGFLKRVIQATDPWVSDKDINAGSFWHEELWAQLESAEAGIVCLTRETLDSKWVHFEAGALAKAMTKACVCPYLVGLNPSDVSGPLASLQCCTADREGTVKMLRSINAFLGDNALTDEELRDSFDGQWKRLDNDLKRIPEFKPPQSEMQKRSSEEILEEILAGIRDLQNRTSISVEATAGGVGLLQNPHIDGYKIGVLVMHGDYGVGKITDLFMHGTQHRVKVRFSTGERTFIAEKARLSIVRKG